MKSVKGDYKSIQLPTNFNITKIYSIFLNRFPKNYVFDGEKHNFWEMVYVEQGELEITMENKNIILHTGEVAFHKPMEFHALKTVGNSSTAAILVGFECNHPLMVYLERYVGLLDKDDKVFCHNLLKFRTFIFQNENIPFKSVPHSAEKINPVYLQLVKSNLEFFIMDLIVKSKFISEKQKNDESFVDGDNDIVTQKVISLLQENVYGTITLDQISESVGYSISHIIRIFKSDMNQSIMQYFIKLKVDEAKRLLAEEKYTASEISEIMQFCNPSYFSRVFKKQLGETPAEFRDKHKYNDGGH